MQRLSMQLHIKTENSHTIFFKVPLYSRHQIGYEILLKFIVRKK